MQFINVQKTTDHLKVTLKNISYSTKRFWGKSINWIDRINFAGFDHDVAGKWLERADIFLGKSTFKARVRFLKDFWNKARKKKLHKGKNPCVYLDNGLAIGRREPELEVKGEVDIKILVTCQQAYNILIYNTTSCEIAIFN